MTAHAFAVAMARLGVNGPEDQRFEQDVDEWETIDWRSCEEQVRRLRQRIFKATREGDWPKVRSLQKLTAPRGALSYPRLQPGGTRREVPGSDGLPGSETVMGDHSMPGKQRSCSGV